MSTPSLIAYSRAFVFDAYNFALCLSQHRAVIASLVSDIVELALLQQSSESSTVVQPPDESALPLSFSSRRRPSAPTAASRKKPRKLSGSSVSSSESAFLNANRQRPCVCVPQPGVRWWTSPDLSSPCGRANKQCGCRRSASPEVGSVWEAWRPNDDEPDDAEQHDNDGRWEAALVVEAARGGRPVGGVFVADGTLFRCPEAWLRPPTETPSLSALAFYGVSPCLCSAALFAALSAPSSSSSSSSSSSAERPVISGCFSPIPGVHDKHWAQRYRYFSRFDEGVRVDAEGWYSVTQESIASHVARRVVPTASSSLVIFDAFCGCGGNAIAFALAGAFVISCDIDPKKIECAKHNAKVYGVESRLEFIVGDSALLLKGLAGRRPTVDVVCLAPPWGGPDYLYAPVFDLERLCCPLSGSQWLKLAKSVADSVVLLVPRTTLDGQIAAIGDGGFVEVEEVAINYKVKMKVGYYGEKLFRRRPAFIPLHLRAETEPRTTDDAESEPDVSDTD